MDERRVKIRPTPSVTPDGKELPQAAVLGDEGGAGISAGGQASAKSGAGLGHDRSDEPRLLRWWHKLTGRSHAA